MACKHSFQLSQQKGNAPKCWYYSGKAIALRLAWDGYDICVNDIEGNKRGAEEVANEIAHLGRKSTVALGDVSVMSDVEAMVQKSVKELGPLNTMQVLPLAQPQTSPLRPGN